MTLSIQPISFKEACAFIAQHHRHHKPPQGWKFGMAVSDGDKVVGVAMVGRPVNRSLDDGWTLEVNRLCTDGTPHVASKLYAASWRAAKAIGYKRLITYILKEETGTSLNAAGWEYKYTTSAKGWDIANGGGRKRIDTHPLGQKKLWEAT